MNAHNEQQHGCLCGDSVKYSTTLCFSLQICQVCRVRS